MLHLAMSPFKRTWQKVEQGIGLLEIEAGKKIVEQNIQLEVKLTIKKEQAMLSERMHGAAQCNGSCEKYTMRYIQTSVRV
jgi:hypothetical protein